MRNGSSRDSAAPRLVTSLPGPRATAWIARDQCVLSPSYTRDYPLVAERGWGCTIEDVDGNRFLDFTAGLAVTATGHAHPQVVEAICTQAHELLHMSGTDFYYRAEIELAERLVQLAPGDSAKRVFFTNSGTETIEAAIKLARYHTGRQRIVSFDGGFHGRTCGSLSITGSKAIHHQGFGPLLAGVHRLPFGCSLGEFERLFAQSAPASEVAAVVVEPVQGEGGYRVATSEFMQMLRRVCDREGIVLVFDEVQTGIGRTGRMFACEHFDVAPDVLCLAKGIASGLPLGALVARADIMHWAPGSHASTFGGNPLSCRAALATLDLVEDQYLANTVDRGRQLAEGLSLLCDRRPMLTGVRGLGLMQAVDVCDANGPSPALRQQLIQAAFQRGLLLVGCGAAGIRFCPALCVTEPQIQTALAILAAACDELAPPVTVWPNVADQRQSVPELRPPSAP